MNPIPRSPEVNPGAIGNDPKGWVANLFNEKIAWFSRAFEGGSDSLTLCRAHSKIADSIVAALTNDQISKSKISGLALFALGGYGRGELGLHSDLDLLFLHRGLGEDEMREISAGTLYPIWDSGAEAGGASRTLADSARMIRTDIRAHTAMMDARFIAGDAGLKKPLDDLVWNYFSDYNSKRRYIETKMEERRIRLSKFGDSIYLLQPNVKEGEGGLRDYHTLTWIARAWRPELSPEDALRAALMDEECFVGLNKAVSFIWRVRHALHIVEGKRNDRLGEGDQEKISEMLGFKGKDGVGSSEDLMSTYYRNTEFIYRRCERALEGIGRELFPKHFFVRFVQRRRLGYNLMRTEHGTLGTRREGENLDKLQILRLFAMAKRHEIPVDLIVRDSISSNLGGDIQNAKEVWTGDMSSVWREIFSSFKGLDRSIAEMRECGILEELFPEMVPMIHRIQHDGLHFFTAGVHSIKSMGELSKLSTKEGKKKYPDLALAMRLVRRPHVLAMATLFHDVGKGQDGKHAEVGADIALGIARRVGFDGRDASDVAFLVRQHLLMSFLAFRRDVRDEGLIERFAQVVRSEEMLAMLYLLTFADIRSIGPGVWSDWKGGLLEELYHNTRTFFERSSMTTSSYRRKGARTMKSVARLLGAGFDLEDVSEFVQSLPERYLLSMDPEAIAAHIMMANEIEEFKVSNFFRGLPERGCTEISIVTPDAPGLFERITGILSANGVNVLDAQFYTSLGGKAIDVLWVADAANQPLSNPKIISTIQSQMSEVIGLGRGFEDIMESHLKTRILSRSAKRRPSVVTVDGDVSDAETIVEIQTDDRRGLLYMIAACFNKLGLTIDRARITTQVDRVIDVFYIRESSGGKVKSPERMDIIEKNLKETIDR